MTRSITDQYASAARSGNMRSKADTTRSDSDVVGAFGLMGKQRPLAAALCRLLLAGDDLATRDVVQELAAIIEGRAWRTNVPITRLEAEDMGKAVLAWYRNGTCTHCDGLGFDKVPGVPALSGNACRHCDPRHPGKVPFTAAFPMERIELAWFTLDKIEREIALAGPAAMAKLAPQLEL